MLCLFYFMTMWWSSYDNTMMIRRKGIRVHRSLTVSPIRDQIPHHGIGLAAPQKSLQWWRRWSAITFELHYLILPLMNSTIRWRKLQGRGVLTRTEEVESTKWNMSNYAKPFLQIGGPQNIQHNTKTLSEHQLETLIPWVGGREFLQRASMAV